MIEMDGLERLGQDVTMEEQDSRGFAFGAIARDLDVRVPNSLSRVHIG